jgi:DNA-binding beta-propeller fold protein YncE
MFSPPLSPAILSQPASQMVSQGATATFTVAANGTQPLYYQWLFNNANILFATTSAFSVADAQPANAGLYSVIVSNWYGSVTSVVATLTVDVYALSTSSLLVGPAAASDSVVLAVTPQTGAWAATANSTWLHLTPANQSGTGSANVVFSYDANPGATRSGTLTIAGQTLTVTQAGSTYVPAGTVTFVSSGLSGPSGVAVDGAGNVYIADTGDKAIKEWTAANNTLATLVSSVLSGPEGVAVDISGNVYIADTANNAIEEWTAANGSVMTLVSGLNAPAGVAVDGAGNVYIADTGNNAIREWTASNGGIVTLVSSGLNNPSGVAVDAAGNVYIADTGNSAIKEWTPASGAVVTLVSSGLSGPGGAAVDGGGNVYIADTGNNAIKEWVAAGNAVVTLVPSGLSAPSGVAVDGAGNVYIADTANNAIKELPCAFVDPTAKSESLFAGNDTLPLVLPATANLLGPFAPASDQPWLTISGITNGVVTFFFSLNLGPIRTGNITLLGQTIPVTQADPTYSVRTTALVEGPAAGNDSVVLAVNPSIGPWTATPNASWLHVSPANQSGAGSANVVFNYDANPGATRSGTLTIAGYTVAVTQAGSTYIAAAPATLVSSGLSGPSGVAVDGAGNVYIADTGDSAIKEWTAANNVLTPLVSSGLSGPDGVAVDIAGDVYIADTGNNAIEEWTVDNGSLVTLLSGLNEPGGVAVDAAGNVYVADTGNNAIKEWTVVNYNVITLAFTGLNHPSGVAVDGVGNVYVANTGNDAIEEWSAANNNIVNLITAGLNQPRGVAVDGGGNAYVADTGNNAIKEWKAAANAVLPLVSSGLSAPSGMAVDGVGDVFIADTGNNAIKELSRAFVDPTAKSEGANAGVDVLPAVVPATQNLIGPLTPTSDSPWLTITGVANGVVSFSFTPNFGPSRTANIALLGQTIPVTQGAFSYSLGTTALLEGPVAGSDSVALAVNPNFGPWTAIANAPWLHLSSANQSGTGSANVIFSYDANPDATRSATLAIAGQTLTVNQAGSTYIAAGTVTTLVSSGLSDPSGVAVDGAGNVYIADTGDSVIKEWTVANSALTTVVPSGLSSPDGIAVDIVGDVYIADTGNNAIQEWLTEADNLATLLSGLKEPGGVALDGAGNVYIADTGNSAIKQWTPNTSSVILLVSSGLNNPSGVALDGAANVYIADTGNGTIKEWTAANSNVVALISSGLNEPKGVAVDGGGNVYIADTGNNAIKEWAAAGNIVTAMVSSGLSAPSGVAVDGAGNVFIADAGNGAIKELPHAFLDPTPKSEGLAAGSDALPAVVPASENLLPPFAPTSDQSWLTITGVADGVVSFSFLANTGPSRTARITLLGQSIAITQGGVATPVTMTLTGAQILDSGGFQLSFTGTPGASFTVLSSTNLSVPLNNWTVVGAATSVAPGQFQFTSPPATNNSQCFYVVRSP